MKICTTCGQEKSEEEFHWRIIGVHRHTKCKECANKLARRWARENRDRGNLTRRGRTERNYRAFNLWLSRQVCVDCGEDDMVVFELHHRDPSKKNRAVSAIVSQGFGLQALWTEVDKCDVLCANCHRRRHFEVIDGRKRARELAGVEK